MLIDQLNLHKKKQASILDKGRDIDVSVYIHLWSLYPDRQTKGLNIQIVVAHRSEKYEGEKNQTSILNSSRINLVSKDYTMIHLCLL